LSGYYTFDPDTGGKVWERHTAGMEVPLSDEDRAQLKGTVFTHDHPRGWAYPADDPRRAGSSFSPHDIRAAALADMAEMRAVAPGYVFTIRPREGGLWPAPDQVGPVFDMVKDKNDHRTSQAIIDGSIDPREAIADGPHQVWVELAPLMGLEYRRVAPNGD
jgi:hypothetical protein